MKYEPHPEIQLYPEILSRVIKCRIGCIGAAGAQQESYGSDNCQSLVLHTFPRQLFGFIVFRGIHVIIDYMSK